MYADLYNYIEATTSRELTAQWQATVRREVENHSTDSGNYRGGDDLFYSVEGLGQGIWGLRTMRFSTTKVGDKISKVINIDSSAEAVDINDIEEQTPLSPGRAEIKVTRVIRDTKISKRLKLIYNNRCQVCHHSLKLGDTYYSEGHHLRPLGGQHKGPDIAGNMIIVCPNHHVEFDYGAIAIDPDTFDIIDLNGHQIGTLTLANGHNLQRRYVEYHFAYVYKKK